MVGLVLIVLDRVEEIGIVGIVSSVKLSQRSKYDISLVPRRFEVKHAPALAASLTDL